MRKTKLMVVFTVLLLFAVCAGEQQNLTLPAELAQNLQRELAAARLDLDSQEGH